MAPPHMPDAPRTRGASDADQWVDRHGDALYRYALLQLRDAALAEDAVQQTFLAALHARERFAGQAAERTWLIGILKHKIIDVLRQAIRQAPIPDLDAADPAAEQLFTKGGKWKTAPRAWTIDPADAAVRREFWNVLTGCLSRLPPRLAQAFLLRELDDVAADEVCKILDVSPTNLWTLLHRARLRLRQCLEAGGFGRKE